MCVCVLYSKPLYHMKLEIRSKGVHWHHSLLYAGSTNQFNYPQKKVKIRKKKAKLSLFAAGIIYLEDMTGSAQKCTKENSLRCPSTKLLLKSQLSFYTK